MGSWCFNESLILTLNENKKIKETNKSSYIEIKKKVIDVIKEKNYIIKMPKKGVN